MFLRGVWGCQRPNKLTHALGSPFLSAFAATLPSSAAAPGSVPVTVERRAFRSNETHGCEVSPKMGALKYKIDKGILICLCIC